MSGEKQKDNAGGGAFRRRVIAVAETGVVRAGVEDDMHHFEVTLMHDGKVVTGVTGSGPRTPWSTCSDAAQLLSKLIGTPLTAAIYRNRILPDPQQQCTHMYELALLAVAQAARGGRRQYDIFYPDPPGKRLRHRMKLGNGAPAYSDGPSEIALYRDGDLYLEWHLQGQAIADPPLFAGQTVRTVTSWALEHCDDETVEAVRILRRGLHVSYSRDVDMDSFPTAADMPWQFGACHTFQPEQRVQGTRNVGATLDFTTRPDDLLINLKEPTTR